jgi:predicted dehydrogenase
VTLRLAIIGVGAIGQTHLAAIAACSGVSLAGVLDPAVMDQGLPRYKDLDHLIGDRPDGVILSAPNALHAPIGVALLDAGLPVLIEKPLAETLDACERLVTAATRRGLPALVSHHRRHNPIIAAAKAQIDSGAFGQLVSGTVMCSLFKPASYYQIPWRTAPGSGGPVLINAIHEFDLLRHLFGDVTRVTARTSDAQRSLPVEDNAAAILEFASGGMITISLSDAAVGPWAWDLTAGENIARFPAHAAVSHLFAGTRAGFSLPDLAWWSHDGTPDWTKALTQRSLHRAESDSYLTQISHFAEVIRGRADPAVTLADGLAAMRLVDAIYRSAAQRRVVDIDLPASSGLGLAPSVGV